jgi:periplasmic divalent cation tolerance protein
MIAVVTTLHKKEDAVRIGKGLLEKRLIACYNLWAIESSYWWKGEVLEEPETMMLLKTQSEHFDEVAAYIKEQSGYEVPDIFTLSPGQVWPSFDKWIHDETSNRS